MWHKNQVNWTEKQTQMWESMALERSLTGIAYKLRLVLHGIYERTYAEKARKLFLN